MADTKTQREEAELRAEAQLMGKKIALLLHAATIPDDVKEAWITLLPTMSVEELDQFAKTLESRFLIDQTRTIDAQYQAQFAALAEQAAQANLANDLNAARKLSTIEALDQINE